MLPIECLHGVYSRIEARQLKMKPECVPVNRGTCSGFFAVPCWCRL